MATAFLPSISPLSNPTSHSSRRKPCCLSFQIPNLHTQSLLKKGFSKVLASTTQITPILLPPKNTTCFTLPKWRNGRYDQKSGKLEISNAVLYLEYMVGKGHKPDLDQSTQLLNDLLKINKDGKAIRVMEVMLKSGTIPNPATCTLLVNMLCKRGGRNNIGYAMQLVEKMDELGYPPNNTTDNLLVRGLCIYGTLKQSLQALDRLLLHKGFVPDKITYSSLLGAAIGHRGVNFVVRLLDEIIAKGGKPNLVSYNTLLTGLCVEGRTEEAIKFFRSIPSKGGFHPDLVTAYNILIKSLCDEGRWKEVNDLLAEMVGQTRAPITISTYNMLIKALALHGRTDAALEVLEEMKRRGFKPDTKNYNQIIDQFCKEGKVDMVLKCLDQMISGHCIPDNDTYNSLALLCVEGKKVQEAFSIVQRLINKQRFTTPYDFYNNVLSGMCKKQNTYAAMQLLYEMTKNGFTPDTCTYSSFIRGLCLGGMFDEAREIITVMEEYDCAAVIDNYNALIHGLCKAGRTDLSLDVFQMMIEKGIMPNKDTYVMILKGIAHEKELEMAADLLRELYQRHVVSLNTVEGLMRQYDLD